MLTAMEQGMDVRRSLRHGWAAWLLALLWLPAWAAELQSGYLLDHWGTADGLPVKAVSAVLVGRDGYVWLSSYGGLVRFDGSRFTTFDSSTAPGLSNDRLMSLAADADGVLWMLDETRHLESFDGHRFRSWSEADGLPPGRIEPPPKRIGDTLWVGSAHGPAVFDARTRRWHQLARTGSVNTIEAGDDGRVWVGTADGLLRFDGAAATTAPARVAGLLHAAILALMHEPRTGALWIATAAGVVRKLGERVEHIADYSDVLRIETDDDGSVVMVSPLVDHVWRDGRIRDIASDRGEPKLGAPRLVTPDGAAWSSRRGVVRRNGEAVLEIPCAVDSMAMDASGSIWLASQCEGLQRIRQGAITALTRVAGRDLGPVYGLAQTHDGTLWMGLLDGTVAVLRADGTQERLGAANGFGDLVVPSFFVDADDTLWAARTRLCIIRDEHCATPPGTPPELDPTHGQVSGLLSADIRGIYRDRSGTLWVGAGNGLWSERGARWTRYFAHASLRSARAFAETADGSLWIGTVGDGLLRRRPDGNWVRHGIDAGLSSLRIRALHVDDEGRLWVATEDRGLCRSLAQQGDLWRFACIGRAQGLWSDKLHRILVDRRGYFWISSNQGLMRARRAELDAAIERRAPRVYPGVYTERDGLPDSELDGGVDGSGIVLADGRLAFPTQNGVAFVDPERAHGSAGAMRAVIEAVSFGAGKVLDPVADAHQGVLVLPRGERSFGVRFTALSPELSPLAWFRYRLLPDERWIDLGTSRQLNLSRLPPGRHVIEVVALNGSGEPGEPARVSVELPPWFYETAAFRYGMPMLLIMLALAWLWRQRARAARHRRELEATVSSRTAQLSHALETVNRQNAEIGELAASKSRFFANVSHELRTPLALISGPLRDAARGEPILPQAQRIMLANAQRLERLVTQLLDLERIDAGRFPLRKEPRDLARLLRDAVEAFGLIASRQNVALTCVGAEGPCPVSIDVEQVERLFGNLLSNALKFTPAGGRVEVALHEADGWLRVHVDDSGPGVPREWRERIFDRFSQVGSEATRPREGAGLGLVLCREIARLHAGRLWVEERPGGGSRFVFELPRDSGLGTRDSEGQVDAGVSSAAVAADEPKAAQAAAPFTKPESPIPNPGSSRRILVVEDHPDLRAYVSGILARDHEVMQAADGAEGLESAIAELPDLIVSDIMMPRMDGITFVRALRERGETAGIPVIFLTARAGEADEIEGLACGADQYLRKPFDAGVLRAHVAAALHAVERLRRHFQSVAAPPPAAVADTPSVADPREAAFAARARDWLQQRLHEEDLAIPRLADALHVSRATLTRRLTALTGESPGALLRRLRMERARDLLARGEGSVSEVAYAVGYASLAAFSRAYREHYGHAPSDTGQG
jgi:signal transduction histidine kinase/ligand-binding sensor domain-containing protein/DNA-binding response OmpR family regulator